MLGFGLGLRLRWGLELGLGLVYAISARNYSRAQTLCVTLKGLRTAGEDHAIMHVSARPSHAGPAKRSRTQLQQLSVPPPKSLRVGTEQPLASFVQHPHGVGSPMAFAPHPISQPVTNPTRPAITNPTHAIGPGADVAHPTYDPVPGADVAPRPNSKAAWLQQFNNLALAEQRLRLPLQSKEAIEDVHLAAAFVKGETPNPYANPNPNTNTNRNANLNAFVKGEIKTTKAVILTLALTLTLTQP